MPTRPGRLAILARAVSNVSGETWWRPPADVYRTRNGWILKFELAGVRPEDLALEVTGSRIKLSGRRRDWPLEEGCRYHSLEISYSRFERYIELPSNLEGAQVALEWRDGILLVRVTIEEKSGE